LSSAKLHNILVVRVPEYSPHAVAEHAVAMLLTLNRKIHKAYNRIKEGDFSLNNLLGFDLYQKNVGVLGAGKIGTAFVKIMLGFGCNVFIYDPVHDQSLVEAGAKYVDINSLFAKSDIISLHCPLNQDTFHIINATSIELMKPGVFIINTSRGAIINTKAAKASLKSGQIGYLALDVYEQEDGIFFHDLSQTIIHDDLLLELITYPNVLITSHQGFFTKEALIAIATITAENINSFLSGKITNQITI
ncbi:MAG TPA: NAD(P)-dependent oxidoreductase, partial [Aquella sp.]|nr:NAD(P)-dependent oxidoreductase [Aquella sp.]